MPDWIVVPGGNLGNSSAFGKAFGELRELGLIDRVPRLAVINAAGANTLYELYEKRGLRWNGGSPDGAAIQATTRDGRARTPGQDHRQRHRDQPSGEPDEVPPAPWRSATAWSARSTDQEILDAKAQVGAGGLGCEPASAASVAGLETSGLARA